MAVRKPRPPRLTGNSGISRRPMARAAESSVPSPPSTMTRSQPSGTSLARQAGDAAGVDTRSCSSHAHCDAAAVQPVDQLGHHARRRPATFGLEMIPTVLMMGIEEKLLVPFGAENRAFHDAGLESEFAHGRARPGRKRPGGAAGSRTMPPLPTWPLPTSNCGLISITICPPGCNSGTAAGRIRVTEMKLTSQRDQVHRLADVLERQLARVDAFVHAPRADRCAASSRAGRRPHPRHARAPRRACSRHVGEAAGGGADVEADLAGRRRWRNGRSAAASLNPPRLT